MDGREHFWAIDQVGLFYVLAAAAMVLFGWGATRRARPWLAAARAEDLSIRRLSRGLGHGLSGIGFLRGDRRAGVMHALIAWGFTLLFVGTVLSTLDHCVVHFLRGRFYLVYSVVLDVAGIALLLGLCAAAARRYLLGVPRLDNRAQDALVLVALAAATASGFAVEALRLSALQPDVGPWSFGGTVLGAVLPRDPAAAEAAYPLAWWLHALVCLGLIAAIPWTRLAHILAAPAHLAVAARPAPYIPIEDRPDESPPLAARDLLALDACTRCGRCVDACPATGAGEPFSPRAVLDAARGDARAGGGVATSGDHAAGSDGAAGGRGEAPVSGAAGGDRSIGDGRAARPEVATDSRAGLLDSATLAWHCTTCGACLEACPIHIATADLVRAARRVDVEDGTRVPAPMTDTLERLQRYGNPWESTRRGRSGFHKELGLPDLSRGAAEGQLAWVVGCTTAIDTRARGLARAFTRLAAAAELELGTLGKKEGCCGDVARQLGEDGLFEDQQQALSGALDRAGAADLVASSPHCLAALQRHGRRVRHTAEVLDDLLRSGALRLPGAVPATVTFHDPCYLGRLGGVFDAPRRVLAAVPGIEVVEMGHTRQASLCCGGGGGRMWQEGLECEDQMSGIRVREAAATGASMLVTACPLCLVMLDDARKAEGLEDRLQVIDLCELAAKALDGAEAPHSEQGG